MLISQSTHAAMPLKALTEQRRQKKYAQVTQGEWQYSDEDDEKLVVDNTLFSPAAADHTSDRTTILDVTSRTAMHSSTVVELQPTTLASSSFTSTSAPLPGSSAAPPPDEVDDCLQVSGMVGLKYSVQREILYYTLTLVTGSLSSLLAFWFPVPSYLRRYSRCSLADADFVLVSTKNDQHELCEVEPITAHPTSELPELIGRYRRPHIPPLSPTNRMIVFRHTRYIYDVAASSSPSFVRRTTASTLPCSHITAALLDGQSSEDSSAALSVHGGNELSITVPSVPSLLIHEVLHPFFVFQIFSLVLWCFEAYFYFAACIFIIATVSIATTVVETRRRLFALAELARFSSSVNVLRDRKWVTLSSSALVPGDVVQVGTGVVPCDLALLSGSCVVNESMLTGESLPILKSSVDLANKPPTAAIRLTSASHTLFSATSILQLKPAHPHSHPLALVTRTGWSTTKGSLILSILYPTPSVFRFVSQSFKFIGILFCLSVVGFLISVVQLERLGASAGLIVVRALDLVTIIVPPSLPLALSVGTNYALVALRRAQVCCISPNRINMAGKVRVMCFDKTGHSHPHIHSVPISKTAGSSDRPGADHCLLVSCLSTGTLTSDGMEMKGVREVSSGQFRDELVESVVQQGGNDADSTTVKEDSGSTDKRLHVLDSSDSVELDVDVTGNGSHVASSSPSINVSPMLLCGMACCHSLAVLDGELIGDPLEVQIFRATHATLIDKPELSNIPAVSIPSLHPSSSTTSSSVPSLSRRLVRVLHQYEFQSSLQRMSVICRDDDGRTLMFTKGAPEVIARLCTVDSLPNDYTDTFSHYARHGYRIIAIACKQLTELPLADKDAIRPQLESDLTMLGLLVLENKVKPETAPTLAELQAAKVRCVMVTGDHVVTALSVASECGLVQSDTRIYQGHLKGEEVHWVDTADDSAELDPLTLRPVSVTQPHKYELAVTGDVFRHLSRTPSLSTLFRRVVLSSVIFARMTPDQKALLLTSLQSLQLYAGMTGDGANDTVSFLRFSFPSLPPFRPVMCYLSLWCLMRCVFPLWLFLRSSGRVEGCPRWGVAVYIRGFHRRALHIPPAQHPLRSHPAERRTFGSSDFFLPLPLHCHVQPHSVQCCHPRILRGQRAGQLAVPVSGHAGRVHLHALHRRHGCQPPAEREAAQRRPPLVRQPPHRVRPHGHLCCLPSAGVLHGEPPVGLCGLCGDE